MEWRGQMIVCLGHSLEAQKFPVACLASEEPGTSAVRTSVTASPEAGQWRPLPSCSPWSVSAGTRRKEAAGQGPSTVLRAGNPSDVVFSSGPAVGQRGALRCSPACLICPVWCLMFTYSVTRSTTAFALALWSLAMGKASSGTIKSFQIRRPAYISCTTETQL